MIEGVVTEDGIPSIPMEIAGRDWTAIVDSGFNGDLELPEALKDELSARWIGPIQSVLAANQVVDEELFRVTIVFDGQQTTAEATFVSENVVLIGTRLMKEHRLEIDFPNRTVQLVRTHSGNGQTTQDQ